MFVEGWHGEDPRSYAGFGRPFFCGTRIQSNMIAGDIEENADGDYDITWVEEDWRLDDYCTRTRCRTNIKEILQISRDIRAWN